MAHSAQRASIFVHARTQGLGVLVSASMTLLTAGTGAAEQTDCYPNCGRPTAAFVLAEVDYEGYRAKREAARAKRDAARAERDAANAKRRMLEAKRRDRMDGERRARDSLKKLQRKLKDGNREQGYGSSRRDYGHGSNDGQAGAHCIYGVDGKLIYAPKGAECASEKGGVYTPPASPNPAITQGCAQGNCRNGEGTYVWSDGSRYVGGFKNGVQHGEGSLAFTNGASYVGSWDSGKRSGVGTAIFPDGRVKAGEWKDNRWLGSSATAEASQRRIDWPDLSQPAASTGGGEKDYAVIVGIEDYAHVAKIPGAERNAVDWYRHMIKTRGIPSDRVTLLLNEDATREEVRLAAEDAAQRVGRKGNLWFVFIGHGAPSPSSDDGLLIGFDAQQKVRSLTSRSIKRSDLIEILEGSRAAQINVVLDACFSGRSGEGEQLVAGLQPLVVTSSEPTSDKRTSLMTAAASDQYAGPLPGANRPAFSYLTLGGLRGWADENADGRVSAGELHRYTARTMRSTIRGRRQTPTFVGEDKARLGLSANEKGPDVSDLLLGSRKSASSR